MAAYTEHFYDEMVDTNRVSAETVVPIVLSYVPAKSVVDVGCGEGLWASAFSVHGVNEVCGIDGAWVKPERLVIPEASFVVKDLEKAFHLDRSFDLAISLEVGEHLPASSADDFVKSLTALAPVVLFSAAIPLQGGSRHVNEQWPEYWAMLFKKYGYVPVDCIRRKVWDDKKVSFFYAQNVFFFVRDTDISRYPKLKREIENGNGGAPSFVHPHMYLYYAERWRSIVPLLGKLPPGILHTAKKLINRVFRR